jgi:hypothetical protein
VGRGDGRTSCSPRPPRPSPAFPRPALHCCWKSRLKSAKPTEPACGATKSQLHQPPRTGRKICEKLLQFRCSLCIIFASLLHACLALCVEQVNERKVVCVCVCSACGKAALKPARSRHQQAFLGLVLTAARLLAPTKSATHAKRQHVLFG